MTARGGDTVTDRQKDACRMLLRQEKSMVDICRESAAAGTDLALRELYEDMAARHAAHCDLLTEQLKENADGT